MNPIQINLPIREYHAHPAIGSSGMNEALKSPRHYYTRYVKGKDNKPTDAMEFGSAAHMMVLEPYRFDEEYAIAPPDVEKRTVKKWKEFVAETDKTSLLHRDYTRLLAMRKVIESHHLAANMIKGGIPECSYFAECEETGLKMKARPDYHIEGIINEPGTDGALLDCIIDYKTTAQCQSPEQYRSHCFRMGRHLQAYHHKTVTEMATGNKVGAVLHIVQETEEPYDVMVYRMSEETLSYGGMQAQKALDILAECQKSGVYPGYRQDEIITIEPPAWVVNSQEKSNDS